jgi:hypothetical protein
MPIGKKSSKVRDKWQRKMPGMPIYATFGTWQPTIKNASNLRAKWQYRVSRVSFINHKFIFPRSSWISADFASLLLISSVQSLLMLSNEPR